MKHKLITIIGIAGSTVVSAFGGWDRFLQTLIIFMIIDWLTGGILLPVVFKKSPKSKNGALESRAGWKGLCRKSMTLLYVLIGAQLDVLMGTEYVRDAVCIGFIANEALSIVENAGLMGLPMPEAIRKAIDVLKNNTGNNERKEETTSSESSENSPPISSNTPDSNLPTNPPKTTLNKTEKYKAVVTTNSGTLNVRTWPGTEYSTCSFSPLSNGTEVYVCDTVKSDCGEDWYYIKYKGRYGFAYSRYVSSK